MPSLNPDGSHIIVSPDGVYIDGHKIFGVLDVDSNVDGIDGMVEATIRIKPASVTYGSVAPMKPVSDPDDRVQPIDEAIAKVRRRKEGHDPVRYPENDQEG